MWERGRRGVGLEVDMVMRSCEVRICRPQRIIRVSLGFEAL